MLCCSAPCFWFCLLPFVTIETKLTPLVFHTDKGNCWIIYVGADTSYIWHAFLGWLLNGQSTVAMTSLCSGLGRNRGRWWGRSGQQQSCGIIGWGKWCNGFHWPHSPRLFKNWSQSDEREEPWFLVSIEEVCQENCLWILDMLHSIKHGGFRESETWHWIRIWIRPAVLHRIRRAR